MKIKKKKMTLGMKFEQRPSTISKALRFDIYSVQVRS